MTHFKISEFDSPDLPGSGVNMNKSLLIALDDARTIARIPFRITSGYRTIRHNDEIKGKKDSSHLKGLAVDIYCVIGSDRLKIVKALLMAGFTRIGIASNFIHADTDNEKPDSIWLY